jgi:hypothetical protein
MSAWASKRTLTVVTACLNAGGTPDFAVTEVAVTHAEYANGVHCDLAEQRLVAAGYEEPFLHFDELDGREFLVPAVRLYLGAADTLQPDHPIFLGGT